MKINVPYLILKVPLRLSIIKHISCECVLLIIIDARVFSIFSVILFFQLFYCCFSFFMINWFFFGFFIIFVVVKYLNVYVSHVLYGLITVLFFKYVSFIVCARIDRPTHIIIDKCKWLHLLILRICKKIFFVVDTLCAMYWYYWSFLYIVRLYAT